MQLGTKLIKIIMLKDNLYTITSLNKANEENYTIDISLNKKHAIFEGHFPGQPILPGVCMIEMVKEILLEIKQKPYQLVEASNIKYLRLVDPNENPTLHIEMQIKEEGQELMVNVNSCLQDGGSHFKFKGSFFNP